MSRENIPAWDHDKDVLLQEVCLKLLTHLYSVADRRNSSMQHAQQQLQREL